MNQLWMTAKERIRDMVLSLIYDMDKVFYKINTFHLDVNFYH